MRLLPATALLLTLIIILVEARQKSMGKCDAPLSLLADCLHPEDLKQCLASHDDLQLDGIVINRANCDNGCIRYKFGRNYDHRSWNNFLNRSGDINTYHVAYTGNERFIFPWKHYDKYHREDRRLLL
ncbi:hypothetical protein FALBO_11876 [Fusarium albosuccineum]|uniref:Avirulence Effector AvrLm4-7 domain-containing protein n=1 Tax=Fusarium albosuccineum TaxID=1237068 RepID=A0A8H4L490_9HYPO|nr:hypothetical protein FALBO_11876 [Fusarium albosuccineum]